MRYFLVAFAALALLTACGENTSQEQSPDRAEYVTTPQTELKAEPSRETPKSISGDETHTGPNPHAELSSAQHIAVASQHMENGRTEEALDVLARATAADPDDRRLTDALSGLLNQLCKEKMSGGHCLMLASAHFSGETKLGIRARDIIEAYHYTKLACDHGSEAGCDAYKAAMEKGELVQNVLFEPGIDDRDAQLKEAIQLGADLNATTLFSATLLQQAISEENLEAVRLLLDNGADVNYRVGDDDLTPLMYAINSGNQEMVTLLLDRGADTRQVMKVPEYLNMGKREANACDFAHKLENREMMGLLNCADAAAASE